MSEAMFICEACGKVYPETCPTCPDSGGGATVHQIKQALRDSPRVADVNHAARNFGGHVAILYRAGSEGRAMAIQIKNLAAYRRWQLGYRT